MSLGEGLDDFLISLAEGLAEARDRLAEWEPGPAAVTYQVPRLEFEVKVNLTTETVTDLRRPVLAKRLLVAPPNSKSETSSVSVIRGAFVAVPVEGGIPRPSLLLAVRDHDGEVTFTVGIRDVNGQPLAGIEVELNVDRERSKEINGRALASATNLSAAIVVTNEHGEGSASLLVGATEPTDTAIVVVADAAGSRDTLIYRTRG